MRALDYLEPLPVHGQHEPLEAAMRSLRMGTPVALAEADGRQWRIVSAIDALAFPLSRQLCDVPSRPLPTMRADAQLEIGAMLAHDVWGATKRGALIGRVDTLRVATCLAEIADRDSVRALAVAARDRLMPRLLHDLSNALTIALTIEADVERVHFSAAVESMHHAAALVMHMRSLYTERSSPIEGLLDVRELLDKLEPMLRVATAPATLTLDGSEGAAIRGQQWRLESALLNLALNASELASAVCIRVERTTSGTVEVIVEDDGPGFAATPAPAETDSLHGHGIPSIRRQVALLGGRMRLEQSPTGGALVRISLPLAQ